MSLRSLKSGATAITEAGVLQFITDLLKGSGVLDVLAGHFKVTPGSGLAVNIAVGRAYLLAASGGNGYPVINDAAISNLAITANASGNPRITAVVLYKNLSTSANSDDTNTCHVTTVDGTAGASPVAPTDTTIQSAVGAGNPFVRLANVTVASGSSSLTTGNIDNSVMPQVSFRSDIFNQDQWVTVNATGGTTTLDLSKGKKFQVNLQTSSTTLALLNVPLNCKSIDIRLTQANGGSSTVTWWANLAWAGGVTPVLTTTNGKSDEFLANFLSVTNDTTNLSEGFLVGLNI